MGQAGYYRVHLENEGFKTPVVVYALSDEQAVRKAIDDLSYKIPNAQLLEIEGPIRSFP